MSAYNEQTLKARANAYVHKSKVLRQIHSEKLKRSRRWNNVLNYSTMIISALVTFSTFFGVRNIHSIFLSKYIDITRLDFSFNFLILMLLIASFLQMTLNLGEKSLGHLNSIRELTNFLTDLDDVLCANGLSNEECEQKIDRLNFQYKSINATLPDNSDAEWRSAKEILGHKGQQ